MNNLFTSDEDFQFTRCGRIVPTSGSYSSVLCSKLIPIRSCWNRISEKSVEKLLKFILSLRRSSAICRPNSLSSCLSVLRSVDLAISFSTVNVCQRRASSGAHRISGATSKLACALTLHAFIGHRYLVSSVTSCHHNLRGLASLLTHPGEAHPVAYDAIPDAQREVPQAGLRVPFRLPRYRCRVYLCNDRKIFRIISFAGRKERSSRKIPSDPPWLLECRSSNPYSAFFRAVRNAEDFQTRPFRAYRLRRSVIARFRKRPSRLTRCATTKGFPCSCSSTSSMRSFVSASVILTSY